MIKIYFMKLMERNGERMGESATRKPYLSYSDWNRADQHEENRAIGQRFGYRRALFILLRICVIIAYKHYSTWSI